MAEGAAISGEVLVLGGGPAGATAAALLAEWGHEVVLLTRSSPPAADLAQSIPPSARKLLTEVGALETLERAGLHRNGGNTVWWAQRPTRTEAFPGAAAGWHADRGRLEDVLTARAAACGVRILRAQVHRVERQDERWVIAASGEEVGGIELRAPWLLDASGRAGVLARRERRVANADAPTIALVRRWRRDDGWGGSPPTHTLVESYESGWAWSVPLSERERCVTAMVDPDLTVVGDRGDLASTYAGELARCEHLGPLLEGAMPLGEVWACPASLYSASSFAEPGLLLVGDAGSFIDPLSSYGVKKALASAWMAAVATHTSLTEPAMAADALALHDRNEAEVYRAYRGLSVGFFEEAAGTYGHPFWERRARAAAEAAGSMAALPGPPGAASLPEDPADRSPGTGGRNLPPEEAVRAAWEVLRAAESLSARPGSTLRTLMRPQVRGNRIVPVAHLGSDAWPAGLRWVRGVDLRALVAEASASDQVPDAWEAYCRREPPVPLPDFLAALATAFAAGLLERD